MICVAFRVVVKAQTPNIELGSALMIVSTEMVTVLRLAALPVVEMNVNIEPTVGKRSQYDVVVAVDTTFHHRYQSGSEGTNAEHRAGQRVDDSEHGDGDRAATCSTPSRRDEREHRTDCR
uniref:Secreted protein n=1 Tax=Angiostrongylus cantonensis TaxID=6313 RepID=A0A0K0D6Y9_ANGCA